MKTKRERAEEIQDMAEHITEFAGCEQSISWVAMQLGALSVEREEQEKRIKDIERRIKKLEGDISGDHRLPFRIAKKK